MELGISTQASSSVSDVFNFLSWRVNVWILSMFLSFHMLELVSHPHIYLCLCVSICE